MQNIKQKRADIRNKKVICKNCAPYRECITDINNAHIDNTNDIDVMMSMHSLIEHVYVHSKTPGSLLQYNREEPNYNNKFWIF